ncbi:MFS transporter [Streptomyces sp. NPDC002088]|uniref:MFS transporter n=1 Tax=Streptomyces sp. NPDC002088 TaxID=3154665 RepID=UPI00332C1B1E
MLPGEDRAARRVLTVCLAAGVTTLLDQSVLNIAVPSLRQSLSAGATDVQWIVAGYSLAFGLMLVPGGSLGDVRGRKGLFLVGLSTFVACGLVAATAGHAGTVVAARLVQGARGRFGRRAPAGGPVPWTVPPVDLRSGGRLAVRPGRFSPRAPTAERHHRTTPPANRRTARRPRGPAG